MSKYIIINNSGSSIYEKLFSDYKSRLNYSQTRQNINSLSFTLIKIQTIICIHYVMIKINLCILIVCKNYVMLYIYIYVYMVIYQKHIHTYAQILFTECVLIRLKVTH